MWMVVYGRDKGAWGWRSTRGMRVSGEREVYEKGSGNGGREVYKKG